MFANSKFETTIDRLVSEIYSIMQNVYNKDKHRTIIELPFFHGNY